MFGSLKRGSLLSGSAIYLFSNFICAAIPFALLPILTRYLSPAEYGEVAMFQLLLNVLAALVGLNSINAAVRKYYDVKDSSDVFREFVASCLQIVVGSALALLFVAYVMQEELSGWFGLKAEWIFQAVLVSAGATLINLRLAQWQVTRKAHLYGGLQVAQSTMNILLSLALVVVFHQGSAGRIEAQIWTVTAISFVAFLLMRRDKLLGFFSWNIGYLWEALCFGVPLIPYFVGGILISSVSRLVIKEEMGLGAAGIYVVAFQFSMVMSIAFDALNKAYGPWLFERLKRDNSQEKRQIVRYTYAWYGVVLIVVVMAFIIGPWLVVTMAGPQYASSGILIGWLALGQAFDGMFMMTNLYILYSKRTGAMAAITIVSGAINMLLLVWLMQKIGLEGAAIAYCTATFFRFLLTWIVAQKRHPMPWLSAILSN